MRKYKYKHHFKNNKSTFLKPEAKPWKVIIRAKELKKVPVAIELEIKAMKSDLEKHGVSIRNSSVLRQYKFILDSSTRTRFHNKIMGNTQYVANWSFDKKNKIIKLINADKRENIDYRFKR